MKSTCTCASEAVSTPLKMITIHMRRNQVGFSMPNAQDNRKTQIGEDAFSIWMKETLKKRYAKFENARLPPKHAATGAKRYLMSLQARTGTSAQPIRFHILVQNVANVMCISTSVRGNGNSSELRMYLL